FEQSEIKRRVVEFEESVCGGQSGDAAANDYNALHFLPVGADPCVRPWLRKRADTQVRPYFIKQQPGAHVSARGPRLPSEHRGVPGSVRSRINSRIMATNFGCVPTVA